MPVTGSTSWAPCALGLLLLVAAGGCAAHRAPSPVPQAAGEARPPGDSLETFIGQIQHLSAHARPDRAARALTLEGRDPALAAALLQSRLRPSAAAHRRVAAHYLRHGVTDAAYDHLRAAVRLSPSDGAAYDGLARLWRDWGLPHLGLGDAYRAVHFAPVWAAPRNTLGTILHALGQRAAADREYRQALRLQPEAAFALNNLCYLALEDARIDDALALCRRAVAAEPDLEVARNNLAIAWAAKGQPGESRRVLLTGPDPAAAQFNFGMVQLATGHFADAALAFERAAEAPSLRAAARDRARQARALARAKER